MNNERKKMKKRILLSILLAGCFCSIMHAQTAAQAKQWLGEGNFEKATPAYQKLVKQVPLNATYNYGYGRCCYENKAWAEAESYLKKATARNLTEAFPYLAETEAQLYRFDEAVEAMEKYISLKQKKKENTAAEEKRLSALKQASMMLKGTEQITFVDSLVVDKENFLAAYRVGVESGTLAPVKQFLPQSDAAEATLFQNELNNRRIFAQTSNGKLRLVEQHLLGKQWGDAEPLSGLESEGDQNYPYLLSDGTTLYYADNGENSLGGYDLFVTRFNPESNRFLRPENLGMPFNSPANDYMYVVDEYNQLGWFATDRNQPEGKVCIYLFVPNKSRQTYNYEDCEEETVRRAAQIYRIADTQQDQQAVVEARQRLTQVQTQRSAEKSYEYNFYIQGQTYYHALDDFKSTQAKRLFAEWMESNKGYQQLAKQLTEKRARYQVGNEAVRQTLKLEILDLERQFYQMESDLHVLEVNIRNTEINSLKK
jgi:hypothetical protein